jgi:glycosyltransferase involved in cell wall biosynthesis
LQPLVSIIIPTFNSEKYIAETLESVLQQTYVNWECIIVDDFSTDNTLKIIKQYQEIDNRILHQNKTKNRPKGPSSSRNLAVEIAKGDYLIFLDSDDLLSVNCLKNRVETFKQNPDCDFLVFQMERFFQEPDYTKKSKVVEQNKQKILELFIGLYGDWQVTSPIYKRSFFKTILFKDNLIVYEDLEVAIKAIVKAKNFKIYGIIDSYYRNDENYKNKYNSIEVKIRMAKGFQNMIVCLVHLIQNNSEHTFKNKEIKTYLVKSYKKFFRFTILENAKTLKADNKRIVNLLHTNSILNLKTAFNFYFVDRVLLPFATIKGSGASRLIKFIYK